MKDNNKQKKEEMMPLVSILMAVYKPNYKWLEEQLKSLNNQTYKNLELLIYDDCPNKPLNEAVVKNIITNFNYKIIRGKENRGSNIAFERLTEYGQGDYFAYCDQDDIWENEKISTLIQRIKQDHSVLAYSDMAVINENGMRTANTLIKAKPRIKYIYGENLFDKFFFKNCVSGCCMLVESNIAKKAIPFSKVMVHDQWICVIASLFGKISFINKTLINYRIHDRNQTGTLKGINDKKDYYNKRINLLSQRCNEVNEILEQYFSDNIKYKKQMKKIMKFCDAQINKSIIGIFKYRKYNLQEAYFQIFVKFIPDCLFKIILKAVK